MHVLLIDAAVLVEWNLAYKHLVLPQCNLRLFDRSSAPITADKQQRGNRYAQQKIIVPRVYRCLRNGVKFDIMEPLTGLAHLCIHSPNSVSIKLAYTASCLYDHNVCAQPIWLEFLSVFRQLSDTFGWALLYLTCTPPCHHHAV